MQKNHLTLKNIYVYLHVTNEFSDSDEDGVLLKLKMHLWFGLHIYKSFDWDQYSYVETFDSI